MEDLSISIIEKNQPKEFENIAIIGSGSEFIGQCQTKINPLHRLKFDKSTRANFFEVIFRCFCDLGRDDLKTGHPALFRLDIYVLEKDKTRKKFRIKSKHDPNNPSNYEVMKE